MSVLVRRRRVAVAALLAGALAIGAGVAARQTPAVGSTTLVANTPAGSPSVIGNGSAESVRRAMPKGWAKGGSGTNTRALISATGSAHNGKRFVRTKITKRRSGGAWWFTPAARVKAGSPYTYTGYYRSGSSTVLIAYFTVGRTVVTRTVATVAPARTWTAARHTVTAPAGATAVRFGQVLSAVGYVDVDTVSLASGVVAPRVTPQVTPPSRQGLVSITFDDGFEDQLTTAAPMLKEAGAMPATFYLNSGYLGKAGYLTVAQARQLHAAGHELGGHTANHLYLVQADAATLTREVSQDKKALEGYFGAGTITDFAYPFGAVDAGAEAEVAKHYESGRSGAQETSNVPGQYDKYSLSMQYVLSSTPLSSLQSWIDDAKANKTWLILCYHHVANNNPNDIYTVTAPTFQAQLDLIHASGVKTVTVKQGLAATGG